MCIFAQEQAVQGAQYLPISAHNFVCASTETSCRLRLRVPNCRDPQAAARNPSDDTCAYPEPKRHRTTTNNRASTSISSCQATPKVPAICTLGNLCLPRPRTVRQNSRFSAVPNVADNFNTPTTRNPPWEPQSKGKGQEYLHTEVLPTRKSKSSPRVNVRPNPGSPGASCPTGDSSGTAVALPHKIAFYITHTVDPPRATSLCTSDAAQLVDLL